MNDSDGDFSEQMRTARDVMIRRSAALRELAKSEHKMAIAEDIMREDEQILRKLGR